MTLGALKKSARLASLLLLAVMVLTFFSVFADFSAGYSSVPAERESSEGMLKLSWVSIVFSGQTIRSMNFSEFYGTLIREAGYTAISFSQDQLERDAFGQTDVSQYNSYAGAQVLTLRIARLKAG